MDVFVTTDISKTSLYLHEAAELSYKLYTNITTIDSIVGTTPDLSNFKAAVEDAEWKQEQYNGKDYQTCIFCQYTLRPSKTGELEIKPLNLKVYATVHTEKANDPEDYKERYNLPRSENSCKQFA